MHIRLADLEQHCSKHKHIMASSLRQWLSNKLLKRSSPSTSSSTAANTTTITEPANKRRRNDGPLKAAAPVTSLSSALTPYQPHPQPQLSQPRQPWLFDRHYLKTNPETPCWIDICKRLPADMSIDTPELFDEIWQLHPVKKGQVKIFGKIIQTPRWQQSYGQSYKFSGMNHESLPLSSHWFLEHLSDRIYEHTGYRYMQVLINWYENGKHRIGR